MIRVGFVTASLNSGWTGGLNYMVNLIHAVRSLPNPRIEPVLIVPPDLPSGFVERFPNIDVVSTPIVSRRNPLRILGKLCERALDRNLVMERLLKLNRISVLSHDMPIGTHACVSTISWIPDFQHRRLPDFFSAEEIATRNRMQKRIFDAATIVLLSSFDAQNDLRMCAPEALGKSRVLHFVTGSGAEPGTRPKAALATAYGLDGPYFYLPNQFWIHKNHRIVIDALAILKARGRPALVAATGQTKDYRHPDFFKTLMEHAENAGVTDSFRVLGLVPYEDVPTLMQHCVASINPSLFEGWSTTVEESKAAGKKILLSDIGVHREQAPERGLFFDPDRPETLADLMDEALKSYSPTEDERYRAKAHAELPGRFTAFALNYQQIVVEAAGLNTRE